MFNQYTRLQIVITIRVYKLHYAVLVIWISLLSVHVQKLGCILLRRIQSF